MALTAKPWLPPSSEVLQSVGGSRYWGRLKLLGQQVWFPVSHELLFLASKPLLQKLQSMNGSSRPRVVWRTAHSQLWPLIMVVPATAATAGVVVEEISGDHNIGFSIIVLIILAAVLIRILRAGVKIAQGDLVLRGYFVSRRIAVSDIRKVVAGDYWGPLESLSERLGSLYIQKVNGRTIAVAACSGSRNAIERIAKEMNREIGLIETRGSASSGS